MFSKRLDKVLNKKSCTIADSIFLSDKLEKIKKRRFAQNAILGEGMQAKVVKIDSKYVMRSSPNSIIGDFNNIYFEESPWCKLKNYYGDCVAKLGDVEILKNVSKTGTHLPAGVPKKMIDTSTPEECRKYYENVYLPKFANLPQKAYDNVAQDCSKLNLYYDGESWYRFDVINPNNFVAVGKKIKIVDNIVCNRDDIFDILADGKRKKQIFQCQRVI